MVSQIAVTNKQKKTGWFHVTRSNKLDSQRIYDFGYRSAASFSDAENTQENIPLLLNDFIF